MPFKGVELVGRSKEAEPVVVTDDDAGGLRAYFNHIGLRHRDPAAGRSQRLLIVSAIVKKRYDAGAVNTRRSPPKRGSRTSRLGRTGLTSRNEQSWVDLHHLTEPTNVSWRFSDSRTRRKLLHQIPRSALVNGQRNIDIHVRRVNAAEKIRRLFPSTMTRENVRPIISRWAEKTFTNLVPERLMRRVRDDDFHNG